MSACSSIIVFINELRKIDKMGEALSSILFFVLNKFEQFNYTREQMLD